MSTWIVWILLFIALLSLGLAAYGLGVKNERARNEAQQKLRERIESLPAKQRLYMRMREEGYNYLEIAAELDHRKADVLSELTVAYATLRLESYPLLDVRKQARSRKRVRMFLMRALARLSN